MPYKTGTKLTGLDTRLIFIVTASDNELTHYHGANASGYAITSEIPALFDIDDSGVPTGALDTQVGGDYQLWQVIKQLLTPEEFRGYMKGTAIAYLARERDKGGMEDIDKAGHTLQGLIEMAGAD